MKTKLLLLSAAIALTLGAFAEPLVPHQYWSVSTQTVDEVDYEIKWWYDDTKLSIDGRTFTGVKLSEIEGLIEGSIDLPRTLTVRGKRMNVVEYGDEAFAGQILLESATIPNTVRKLGNYVFADCDLLESVSLGNVRALGEAPFYGSSITSLALPATMVELEGNPMVGCRFLSSISVDDTSTSFTAEDGMLFDITGATLLGVAPGLLAVTLPESMIEIADDAFADCRRLRAIEALCEEPLAGDDILADTPKTLVISADAWTLTSWQDYINGQWKGRYFINYGLEDSDEPAVFTDSQNHNWDYTVKNGVATLTKLETGATGDISIPATISTSDGKTIAVTSIGSMALVDCDGVTKVTIPASITSVPASAFVGCKALTSFDVNADNAAYRDINGVLYSKNGKTLVKVPACVRFATTIRAITTGEQSSIIRVVQHYENMVLIPEKIINDGSTTTIARSVTDYVYEPKLDINTLLSGVTRILDYAFTDCGTLPVGSAFNGTLTTYVDGAQTSKTSGSLTVSAGSDSTNTVTSASVITQTGFYPTKSTIPANWETITTGATDYAPVYKKPSIPASVVCPKMAWYGSVWYDLVDGDTLPSLGAGATAADISKVLVGARDSKLAANITTAEQYDDFRYWSLGVKKSDGTLAGQQLVMDSDKAWQSYAIDSEKLLTTALTSADVSISRLTTPVTSGEITITVSLKHQDIGSNARSDMLSKLFVVRGGADIGKMAEINVEFNKPRNGVVTANIRPSTVSTSFFMTSGIR